MRRDKQSLTLHDAMCLVLRQCPDQTAEHVYLYQVIKPTERRSGSIEPDWRTCKELPAPFREDPGKTGDGRTGEDQVAEVTSPEWRAGEGIIN